MAKEWILNSVMNRFQLNFKRNVGATSEAIRNCQPGDLEEWRKYYFSNVRSEEHIEELGRKLYTKITEVITKEISEISEQDCNDYMKGMVIDRTYEGYRTEIETIYGRLEEALGRKIEAAPDKWDRLYNVDFFIQVGEAYIGIQIKPVNQGIQLPEMHKEYKIQAKTHEKFFNEYGGKVFYVFSMKENNKKVIFNPEVIGEILAEINRIEEK